MTNIFMREHPPEISSQVDMVRIIILTILRIVEATGALVSICLSLRVELILLLMPKYHQCDHSFGYHCLPVAGLIDDAV